MKYALVIVAGLQLAAYPLAKNITNQTILLNMKMTSKGVFVLMTVCLLASCSGNGNNFGEKVKQVSIHRVDSMPDMPETYKMLD